MWISSVELENIKSFEHSVRIHLTKNINILIGPNNAGKSTIIKALHMLQNSGNRLNTSDMRIGQNTANATITLEEVNDPDLRSYFRLDREFLPTVYFPMNKQGNQPPVVVSATGSRQQIGELIQNQEPNNFIYPYLSKRKVTAYSQTVDRSSTIVVHDNLQNLVAKVDRLATKYSPHHEEYEQACIDVFEFPISTFNASNGKQAGIYVDDFSQIPLEAMGEGVPNLLGLIVNLCMAENKLFLVEEIENDVHPRGLKSLLHLIMKKAVNNQFVISTHSNIVMKYLGSVPSSKIHEITLAPYETNRRIPTASYREVGETPEERREVLENLGYDLADSDIWAGWLFLEEATAEAIIVKYLIPTFAPKLIGKLRTVSSGGTSKVEEKFEDFHRLFLFTYLTPIYANKAWVLLDGDIEGKAVIERLRGKYKTCKSEHFRCFSKLHFEDYYPTRFQDQAQKILALQHGLNKQRQKGELVENILRWIDEDPEMAQREFADSASEVVHILKNIEVILS